MKTSSDATALERLLRPLPRSMTAELARALVNLRADPETQARYDELAEKRTEGQLNELEEDELEGFVRANTLLGMIKTEAQSVLVQVEL